MPPRPAKITSLAFSPAAESGHLLAGTAGDQHYILDTWSNAYKWRLVGHQGLDGVSVVAGGGAQSGEGSAAGETAGAGAAAAAGTSGEELCWSPDGNFVLAGTANGEICVWRIPAKEQPPEPGADISQEYMLERAVALTDRIHLEPLVLSSQSSRVEGAQRASGCHLLLPRMSKKGTERGLQPFPSNAMQCNAAKITSWHAGRVGIE